jgi:hypothetical protein
MPSSLKHILLNVLLAFALMLVSSLLWRIYLTARVSDIFPWGFPFQFHLSWGPCPPDRICSEFHPFNLLLDFIIWYLFSAFLFRRART